MSKLSQIGWNIPIIKFFSRQGMYHEPSKGENFRVGPFVGKCIGKTKTWVFMLVSK